MTYIEMEEQFSGIGIEHLPDIRRVRLVGKHLQTTHSTPVYISGLNSRVPMKEDVEGDGRRAERQWISGNSLLQT